MMDRQQIEARLTELRAEYRKAQSILSMMEKGTTPEDLARVRKAELQPIADEISRLERALVRGSC